MKTCSLTCSIHACPSSGPFETSGQYFVLYPPTWEYVLEFSCIALLYLFIYLFIDMVVVKLCETLQKILSLFFIRNLALWIMYIWESRSKSPDARYHQNHMFLGTTVKNILCSKIGNFHLGSWSTLQLIHVGKVIGCDMWII